MLFGGFGMQSCMDNNIEPDPLSGGWEIYRIARSQQNCAMDGANIAFRLNILLTEAVRQYDGTAIDLNNILADDGTTNISDQLFRKGTEFDPATYDGTIAGTYTITYTDGSTTVDYRRKGVVKIDTGGSLLTDDDFDGWYVGNDSDPDNLMQAYLGYDSYTGSEVYANVNFGNYEISPGATNEWNVYVSGYESYMNLNWGSATPVKSNWNSDMLIRANFDEWNYNTLKLATSEVQISGTAEGQTMYWSDSGVQWDMSYAIPTSTPMIFATGNSCGWNYFKSATEKAEILNSRTLVDSSIFPSLEMSVTSVLTNCSMTQIITYNGMVKSY